MLRGCAGTSRPLRSLNRHYHHRFGEAFCERPFDRDAEIPYKRTTWKMDKSMGRKAQISNGVKIRGLVDLQVNGYKGVHFSDINLTRDDFILACRSVFEAGTTAFLPTMITSPKEVYAHNLPIIAS